jgi:hypothetical protein
VLTSFSSRIIFGLSSSRLSYIFAHVAYLLLMVMDNTYVMDCLWAHDLTYILSILKLNTFRFMFWGTHIRSWYTSLKCSRSIFKFRFTCVNGLWWWRNIMHVIDVYWAHGLIYGFSIHVLIFFQTSFTYLYLTFHMLNFLTPISFRLMIWKHLHLHFQFTFCKCSRFIFNIQSHLLDGSWLMV